VGSGWVLYGRSRHPEHRADQWRNGTGDKYPRAEAGLDTTKFAVHQEEAVGKIGLGRRGTGTVPSE